MKSGILVVNKEKDMTSRDVVNVACKRLNTRHIGHTGTLDPIATGVLVLGVNDGCRIIELLTSDSKEYEAKILVGVETDTLDITGNVLNTYNIENLTSEEVNKAIISFKGKYQQEVPIYSAVHVNGKRLYEYARNNEKVDLPKREVEIFNIELIDDIKKVDNGYTFCIRVLVSKGTYIRSLIRDIGAKLGYPTTMSSLKRTKQGIFEIKDSVNLDNLNENTPLLTIGEALKNYNSIVVEDDDIKKISNGVIMDYQIDSDYVLLFDKRNNLLAIYQKYLKDAKRIKPYKVFGGCGNEEIK